MLICFDLDDTLLDHQRAERLAALELTETLDDGVGAAGDAFVRNWRSATEHHFGAFLRGECSFQDQRRPRIRQLFGEGLTDKKADALFAVYLRAYEANWQLFDDVLLCLEALRDVQLGIITNAAQEQQERKLERLGIAQHFSFVLSAERAGCAKPDPAIFALAATYARSTGPHVYVGDNLLLDAHGATGAGWHGIWLDREGRGSSFPRTLASLTKLPEYLESL